MNRESAGDHPHVPSSQRNPLRAFWPFGRRRTVADIAPTAPAHEHVEDLTDFLSEY